MSQDRSRKIGKVSRQDDGGLDWSASRVVRFFGFILKPLDWMCGVRDREKSGITVRFLV